MSDDNTSIKIEKGIPFSPARGIPGRVKDAIKAMKIGDSFTYPKTKQTTIGSAARNYGVKLSTRTISDTEIRVWRVA